MNRKKYAWSRSLVSLSALLLALSACAMTSNTSSTSSVASGPEQFFSTPEQAADALADANRQGDKTALLSILGPDAAKIISSGDKVADKEGRDRFVAAYDKAHKFENDGDTKEILVVGEEEWPLPIPLVNISDKGWQFDTKAGKEEILNRRIGRNEMNVMEICRAYVEAQREYAVTHPSPEGKAEYAQHFISTAGTHDGLYWPVQAGETESPFGPLVAEAQAEGYDVHKKHPPQPYHGYYYKILKRQGPNAAGGARDYIINGHMTGGFALIAFPAKYGDSGVMTFIVNQHGIVFEKNLGPETKKLARTIKEYDPDQGWQIP